MKTATHIAICALASVLSASAAPPTARLGVDAAVRCDGDDARLQFVLFDAVKGRVWETLNEQAMKVGSDKSASYRFVQNSRKVLGTGRAVLKEDGKRPRVVHDITSHGDLRCAALGFVLKLRTGVFAGTQWKADGVDGLFPKEAQHTQCGEGTARQFTVNFPGKRTWTFTFAKSVPFLILDGRRSYQEDFEVRFLCQENPRLAVGKGCQLECAFTSSAGPVALGIRDFHGVWEGDSWVKLTVAEGIRPGTALDLSRGSNRHTPAGVDGWAHATTNGQFRFARRSDAVRFFGCALRAEQQLVDKKTALALAKDFSRYGYDAVRLRTLDAKLLKTSAKGGLQTDPALAAQVDQLTAAFKREGLYVMMDFLGERTWSWSELGLTAPGGEPPSPRVASALFLGDTRTSDSWKSAVELLYGRKNKVSGKLYPSDPSVPLVVPSSDVGVFATWNDLRTLPEIRRGYGTWLTVERKKDKSFLEGRVCEPEDLAVMPLHEQKATALRRFLAETESAGYVRQRKAVAALKSKALVGASFGALHYPDVMKARTEDIDYLCGNFYLDPPRNLGEKWSMPSRLDNVNPLVRITPIPGSLAQYARKDIPFCVTSWSAAGTSSWRALSGLFVGAYAAQAGWDGLWRDTLPAGPLEQATDRAIWALFARGDLSEGASAEAFVVREGTLSVTTERTVGGFSPKADGRIAVPPMVAELSGTRAAVWVSSLTEAPIATSKRLLLTHLTDMQRHGTLYADSRGNLLMRPGTGAMLVRAGRAKIEIALSKAASFRVHPLTTDGVRLARIPSEVRDGVLVFTADVRGAKGAQYLYEIVRD